MIYVSNAGVAGPIGFWTCSPLHREASVLSIELCGCWCYTGLFWSLIPQWGFQIPCEFKSMFPEGQIKKLIVFLWNVTYTRNYNFFWIVSLNGRKYLIAWPLDEIWSFFCLSLLLAAANKCYNTQRRAQLIRNTELMNEHHERMAQEEAKNQVGFKNCHLTQFQKFQIDSRFLFPVSLLFFPSSLPSSMVTSSWPYLTKFVSTSSSWPKWPCSRQRSPRRNLAMTTSRRWLRRSLPRHWKLANLETPSLRSVVLMEQLSLQTVRRRKRYERNLDGAIAWPFLYIYSLAFSLTPVNKHKAHAEFLSQLLFFLISLASPKRPQYEGIQSGTRISSSPPCSVSTLGNTRVWKRTPLSTGVGTWRPCRKNSLLSWVRKTKTERVVWWPSRVWFPFFSLPRRQCRLSLPPAAAPGRVHCLQEREKLLGAGGRSDFGGGPRLLPLQEESRIQGLLQGRLPKAGKGQNTLQGLSAMLVSETFHRGNERPRSW